jgi:hypothetical protein
MSTASEASIAAAFLDELHAPNTPMMRKAVIAWLRAESGGHIIGNNPWNSRPGADDADLRIGTRTSLNGNGKFSIYRTPEDGARAAARRLVRAGHDWRHYDAIVAAARRDDPIGFLNALARSAWDAGKYGTKNGGTNKLVTIYHGIGGLGTVNLNDAVNASFSSSGNLGAWGNIVSFPVGHELTKADVDDIIKKLSDAGFFNGDGGNIAKEQTRTILESHVGDKWSKALQDSLQAQFAKSANDAVAAPLAAANALAGIANTLGTIAAALLDPRKWLLFIALLAGAAMTAWGGMNVARAAA